ncbi:hypothetical protein LCGC14_1016850 [marine sediment metagenome]|uniref:SDR family oxidoreductase n=1 Tax=marine sediment metagenome TaxID=412755 RepID=A0A0F9NK98_9ZZZZ
MLINTRFIYIYINIKKFSIKTLIKVGDISELISYLVSEDSNYTTGEIISICGGVALH